MGYKWKNKKLHDLCRVNVRSYTSNLGWNDFNYLDTGNITQNHISEILCISTKNGDLLPSRARRMVEKGNIIFSTVRPNQMHYGFIEEVPRHFLISTGFAVLSISEDTDAKFVYYYLTQKDIIEHLQTIAEQATSTYPSIRPDDLLELNICVPPLTEQKKISSILTTIDDKIDLNTQINHNLEEQAKAIFKSWFVDFEPFQNGKFVDSELGRIPHGWSCGTLKDLLEVKYGKDHKKLSDGKIPVYGSGGLMRYAEKSIYSGESVLIPRKGTLNNVMRVSGDFWTVDTMFYSIPKKTGAVKYLYHILSGLDLASMNSGSAVPSMTTDILNAIKIILPPDEILTNFDRKTSALWSSREINVKQSAKLACLRDTLLPKLMSGEIDVSEVTI